MQMIERIVSVEKRKIYDLQIIQLDGTQNV